ncbi:MAG: deoxyguanosinetriphosphate triphosphohydrolase [Polyangia bacterium]
MTVREQLEADEEKVLSPHAQKSSASLGRKRPEPLDDVRPIFQHDRDRILHCKAFRRLAGKTQVFLAPRGDHYRTRLTHTLEVAQIARTIARALRLNESLVEAIVMGHDLGHTPFGHAGERVLSQLVPGGFHHGRQSVRVVEVLEREGQGLNLTAEVRDGILRHSKGKGRVLASETEHEASTLEGQIARVADIVAYVNHDLDDAIRARIIELAEVPAPILAVLGHTHSQRISRLVSDVVVASRLDDKRHIEMSQEVLEALMGLRDFLYAKVYELPAIFAESERAQRVVRELWEYFNRHEDEFRAQHWPKGLPDSEDLARAVTDFITGMTDRYAMRTFEECFLPRCWVAL